MNLKHLFELQAKLDDYIEREHPRQPGEDRLAKKILALQVELGELCNCWRGFKFWSNDQEPRTKAIDFALWVKNGREVDKEGKPTNCYKNPLLEEFVDVLHFILSIGLELDFAKFIKDIEPIKNKSITEQFIFIFTKVGTLLTYQGLANYIHIIQNFIGLGEMLGFTWEQVEQGYMKKNAENHRRQDSGVY